LHAFDSRGSEDPFANQNKSLHTIPTDVGTISFTHEGSLDRKQLELWLQGLLWENKSSVEILRLKALVFFNESSNKHVVNAVHELYDITEGNVGDGTLVNKIVLIGKNLNLDLIRDSFIARLSNK
jgi:G3E family GTPase